MKDESVILIDENGLRTDGRRLNELRPIKITAGVSHRADGSAYLEWGGNKVMVAVYGPRETHPRHKQETDRARVAFRYNMAPFSVPDRKRPGPDRRSWEISKVASEAFSNVVFLNEFPRSTIDVVVEVLQADAGTRCAAITCASVALADAGIPMKDMLVSCAAGKINGRVVLDMHNIEDNKGEGDLPLAIVPSTGEIVLLQMDGEMSPSEMDEAMELIFGACSTIAAIQTKALQDKYAVSVGEAGDVGRSFAQDAGAPADTGAPAGIATPPAAVAADAPTEAAPAPEAQRRPPWLAAPARASAAEGPAPQQAPPPTPGAPAQFSEPPVRPPSPGAPPAPFSGGPSPREPQAQQPGEIAAPGPGYGGQAMPPAPAPGQGYPGGQATPPGPQNPPPYYTQPGQGPSPGPGSQGPAQQITFQPPREAGEPQSPGQPGGPGAFGAPRRDVRDGGGQ